MTTEDRDGLTHATAFIEHARGGCDLCLTALREMYVVGELLDVGGRFTYCDEGLRLMQAMLVAVGESGSHEDPPTQP